MKSILLGAAVAGMLMVSAPTQSVAQGFGGFFGSGPSLPAATSVQSRLPAIAGLLQRFFGAPTPPAVGGPRFPNFPNFPSFPSFPGRPNFPVSPYGPGPF